MDIKLFATVLGAIFLKQLTDALASGISRDGSELPAAYPGASPLEFLL
jgi:hypothetical protein